MPDWGEERGGGVYTKRYDRRERWIYKKRDREKQKKIERERGGRKECERGKCISSISSFYHQIISGRQSSIPHAT